MVNGFPVVFYRLPVDSNSLSAILFHDGGVSEACDLVN